MVQVIEKTASETYEAFQARMKNAFDLVCNKEDWKMPINVVIELASGMSLVEIAEAITYFTGSKAEIISLGRNMVKVTAIGYYMATGA